MSSKRAQEEKRIYNTIKNFFDNVVSPANLTDDNLSGMAVDRFIKGFRYTKKEIKLRTHAIAKVCRIAQEKFPELFNGDIDSNIAVTLYGGGIQLSGDHITKIASLGVAAGIWISDVLTEADKIDELNEILPDEFEYSSKVFFDARHSNEIVERIAHVCENVEIDEDNLDILDKIIALIPQEYIDRGIANYDKLAWDIFGIVIKEFYDLSVQKETLLQSLEGSLDISRLGNMSMNAIQSEYYEKMDIANRLDVLDITIATIFSPLQHYYDIDKTALLKASPNAKKVFDVVNKLVIDNPYELCGIFYVLMRKEDYRYWAMGPFATAVSFAAKRLPWTGDLENEERHTGTDFVNEDIYSLNYSSSMFDTAKDNDGRLNLSQLIYHLSGGGILPRRLNKFSSERMILEKNGVSEKQIDFITTAAAVLSELDMRNEYFSGVVDFDEEAESEESSEQVVDISDETLDSLKVLINDIRERIKKVSTENHLIEEQRKKLQKDYDELKRLYQQEHRELVDLRNFTFNQNDEEQDDISKVDLKIDYPYEAKHNIIVFGGHETWSKAIKPLFTNVRFINRDTSPNPDMIKNADIVWVQANSIGHSRYYKILDVVRTYHIPLRYFAYASAEKCAEQIVIEDMK